MLDHTIIVYMSDNGEQHHSRADEWPVLLIGGGALGLKTDGRTVIYPTIGKPGNRQVSNLFNTLGHATGNPSLNEFGGEGSLRIAKGPLGAEIFG
jgi:arylsulfatase A-like enzyme